MPIDSKILKRALERADKRFEENAYNAQTYLEEKEKGYNVDVGSSVGRLVKDHEDLMAQVVSARTLLYSENGMKQKLETLAAGDSFGAGLMELRRSVPLENKAAHQLVTQFLDDVNASVARQSRDKMTSGWERK